MKKSKKLISIYFLIILLSTLYLSIGFYIYDPLQIYHKAWNREITLNKNMRQQAAGIINNYDFDSIILGSSMLQNTSSIEASKKLSGKFINISLSGSTYYERLLIMKYLLKKKKIKQVIYSLDEASYIHRQKAYPNYSLASFDYLYDDNLINDIKAYLNYTYINCLIHLSKSEQCLGRSVTLDRPNAWYNREDYMKRYGGLHKWFTSKNNKKIIEEYAKIVKKINNIESGKIKQIKNLDTKIENTMQYLDATLINFVKENPTTNFILFFPPYSRMYYALWAQYNPEYFEIHKAVISYLTQKSTTLKNLKIFAFGDQKFLNDISNYKDTAHYHYSINSWMLSQIKNNQHLLTQNNLQKYLNTITKKANDFNLIQIKNQIEAYLKNEQ